jgi:hypothetical protein
MKLLSTLRYTSAAGTLAGTGNHGGELRLFFTKLNPEDWKPVSGPVPISWQGAKNGAMDTYNLPSGDVLALNLNIVSDIPGRLYIFGTIQITTATGTVTRQPSQPIGQASSTLFAPGQPAVAILEGRSQGQAGVVQYDVGFELAVPWDGIMADCHGTWWAVWH